MKNTLLIILTEDRLGVVSNQKENISVIGQNIGISDIDKYRSSLVFTMSFIAIESESHI